MYCYGAWQDGFRDMQETGVQLACVASVSVGFGSQVKPRNGIFGVFPARKMEREPKNERGGWGRGRKEILADKPLDFENLRSEANGAGLGEYY